jgi:hypothetical protein
VAALNRCCPHKEFVTQLKYSRQKMRPLIWKEVTVMTRTKGVSLLRFVGVLCLTAGLGFAETWSGALVDARCFGAAEQNHNVDQSLAAQDVGLEIRLCTPGRKTHSFGLVQRDGTMLKLGPSVDADAAKLVQLGPKPKNSLWLVTVNGKMQDSTVAADSILAEK